LDARTFNNSFLLLGLDFDTSQFHLDLLSQEGFILLNDGRSVVDISILNSDDSSFFEILQSSAVTTFFHKEQLFSIPGIQVDRFDERVNNSILSVSTSTIKAQLYTEMDGSPFWIFLLAVNTDLYVMLCTLLLLMFLMLANSLSLV